MFITRLRANYSELCIYSGTKCSWSVSQPVVNLCKFAFQITSLCIFLSFDKFHCPDLTRVCGKLSHVLMLQVPGRVVQARPQRRLCAVAGVVLDTFHSAHIAVFYCTVLFFSSSHSPYLQYCLYGHIVYRYNFRCTYMYMCNKFYSVLLIVVCKCVVASEFQYLYPFLIFQKFTLCVLMKAIYRSIILYITLLQNNYLV